MKDQNFRGQKIPFTPAQRPTVAQGPKGGQSVTPNMAAVGGPGDFDNPPNTPTIGGDWLGWLLALFGTEIPAEDLGTFTFEDGFGFPYDVPVIFAGVEVDSELLGVLLSSWGDTSEAGYQALLELIGLLQPPEFTDAGLINALGPFAVYEDLVIQYMEHDNPFIESPAWVCVDADPFDQDTAGAVWNGSYWEINGTFGGG